MQEKYTLKQLEALDTLHQGHTDDLKCQFYHNGEQVRVWLSRLTTDDGAKYNNGVTIEKYNGDKWITVSEYEAK